MQGWKELKYLRGSTQGWWNSPSGNLGLPRGCWKTCKKAGCTNSPKKRRDAPESIRGVFFCLRLLYLFVLGEQVPAEIQHGGQLLGRRPAQDNHCRLHFGGHFVTEHHTHDVRDFVAPVPVAEHLAFSGTQPVFVNAEDAADVGDCTVAGVSFSFFDHPDVIGGKAKLICESLLSKGKV
nr:MAG TPA: hypothetical protein [Caudoviricetes sp.]